MFQVPREEHSEYLNNLYKGQEDHTIPSYGSSISSLFQHIRPLQQQGQNNTALYVCTQNPFGSNMWLFYQRNSASSLFSSCPGFTPLHCQPLLSLLTTWGHPKEYQGWKQRPHNVCSSGPAGLQTASAEGLSFILLIHRFITFLDHYEYSSFNKQFTEKSLLLLVIWIRAIYIFYISLWWQVL